MKAFPAMAVIAAFTLGILTASALEILWPDGGVSGSVSEVMTEDMPGWDCATMGDLVCVSDLEAFTDMSQPYDRCLKALNDDGLPIALCAPLKA